MRRGETCDNNKQHLERSGRDNRRGKGDMQRWAEKRDQTRRYSSRGRKLHSGISKNDDIKQEPTWKTRARKANPNPRPQKGIPAGEDGAGSTTSTTKAVRGDDQVCGAERGAGQRT